MFRFRTLSLLLAMILSLLSVAAAPQQAGGSLQIAWWVWLVVIALILLVAFVVFIVLDWGEARNQGPDDGGEG
jgi:hypothetical protein